MENGGGDGACVGTRSVRHKPQQQPNAIADYIKKSLDTLTVSEAQQTPPSRRRKPRKRKPVRHGNERVENKETREWVVIVRNMVDVEELEDEDEYQEIMGDLRADFERYGALVALELDRETAEVAIRYTHETDATTAVEATHGRVYGGRRVTTEIQDMALQEPVKLTDTETTQAEMETQQNSVGVVTKKTRKRRTKIKNAVIKARESEGRSTETKAAYPNSSAFAVVNMVDAAEVEDDDEYEEVLQETRETLGRYGAIKAITVSREQADGPLGEILVEYEKRADAQTAFDALDGKIYGGRVVRCVWRELLSRAVRVNGMLDADELEDDDEFADIHGVTSVSISRATGQVTVTYETLATAEAATHRLSQTTYGGRRLEIVSTEQRNAPEKAMPVPKINAQAPPEASVIMKDLLTVFLQRLASLQERAHVQNPLQDKRSRRLVLGLHEVKRGLASRKIKLLILATDVDDCDVLDERLDEIVSIATREQVPVIRAMTRRKLGRILKKHARVSCVGVYSFDGANDLYQELLQERHQT